MPMDRINKLDQPAFTATFGGVYEHSPWIAKAAWTQRPFADATALLEAMKKVVDQSSEAQQMKLICAHPDLAGKLAQAGELTAHSTEEQHAAGLDYLTDEERTRFTELNEAYKATFQFPFIICAKEHSKEEILHLFEKRLNHTVETERNEALHQIHRIARLRVTTILEEALWED